MQGYTNHFEQLEPEPLLMSPDLSNWVELRGEQEMQTRAIGCCGIGIEELLDYKREGEVS